MATIQRFEDLEVWKRSRQLTRRIYDCTKLREFAKDFGLKDQIRRAGISVMSNTAEGFDRNGNREFVQFLAIAKGSLAEMRSQLYVALDQEYITPADFQTLKNEAEEIAKMTASLISYLQKSPLRGTKFNSPDKPKR